MLAYSQTKGSVILGPTQVNKKKKEKKKEVIMELVWTIIKVIIYILSVVYLD